MMACPIDSWSWSGKAMRIGPVFCLVLAAALPLAACSTTSTPAPVASAPNASFQASAADVATPPPTSAPRGAPPPVTTASIPSRPQPHKNRCEQHGDDVYGDPVCIAYSAQ
jgi:hypothetical protein